MAYPDRQVLTEPPPRDAPAARGGAARLAWAASPVLPLLVGLIVRLIGLDRLSFWLDEAYSTAVAKLPIAQIPSADVHPPLYHLLLHGWLTFGDSEAWIRLLSALFGALTIPVVYALGRALWDRQAGLVAAWLLALSPWHVWYSQEARMYAMVCLLATLALLLGVLWVQGQGPLWAVAYVPVALAGLYTEYTMLLVWAPEVLLLAGWAWRRGGPLRALGWIALQALVVGGLAPLFPRMKKDLGIFFSPEFLRVRLGPLGPYFEWVAAAGLALAVVVSLAWLIAQRRRPAALRTLEIVALILLLLGTIGAMLIPTGLTGKRALLVMVPMICLAGAWALAQMSWPPLRLPALAVLSALALAAMFVTLPKEPWRDVVAAIHRAAEPGDLALIEASWMTYPFDYYDRGATPRQGIGLVNLNPQFATQLQDHGRAWLILSQAEELDSSGATLRWFARYPLVEHLAYYHIDIYLYRVGLK